MAINTFIASGNVGNDAELRYLQNDTAVCEFSLPVKQGYGDKQKTAWIKCVLWGKPAEMFAPSIKKGESVTVSGEFYLEEWEKDGVKQLKPCVRVNQIQLAKKSESKQGQAAPAQQKEPEPPQEQFIDDIPFSPIGLQYPNHVIYVI